MIKVSKGISISSLVIAILIIGILAIYGSQIGFGYMNDFILNQASKKVLAEIKANDSISAGDIRRKIEKEIVMNSINISSDDISVTKSDGVYQVEILYNKKIKINSNIDIDMHFDIYNTSN
jgi:hypothetical protein